MELTQQHLDSITNTAKAVNNLTVTVSGMLGTLEKITEQLSSHTDVLEAHTKTLDALVKNTIDWNTEMASVRMRLQIHDQWFKQISEKMDLRLDN